MAKYKIEHDKLEELIRQAWQLTEGQIESLQPGASGVDQLLNWLDPKSIITHPFSFLSPAELERPDMTLLKVMRDPYYIPWTCQHLFSLNGLDPLFLYPFQHMTLLEFWHRQFPMLCCTRGYSKSFLLGLYILLKMTFIPGSRIIVVGRALRQAIVVYEYCERLWYNSPIFRDLVGAQGSNGKMNGPKGGVDRREFVIGDSVCTFLPLGNGETIRGFRATTVIADEFASIIEDVYAIVVQGFGAVSSDPTIKAANKASERVLKRLGLWTRDMDEAEAKKFRGNQSILTGTASFHFNHFARYWKEYKATIESKGDPKKLEELFRGPVPEGFDWRRYSIIRMPWELVPKDFMDESTIARAQQTSSTANHHREYHAIFITDTDGFFKRTLIEKATCGNPEQPAIEFPSCGVVDFLPSLHGTPGRKYVYGVDPASESDKFAIVILEVWPDHRRVVYCWTTDKSDHRARLKTKGKVEHDYFRYCTRKLRNLFKQFPPSLIMVDAGGGGLSIREAFSDPDKLEEGERPVYETIDKDNPKDTDKLAGDHILMLAQFRDNGWLVEANWGLKKDMEDRILVFPRVDALSLGLAAEEDVASGRMIQQDMNSYMLDDTLESCMMDVEELKTELTTIVHTATQGGLEKWTLPNSDGQKKGPLRKDRYSALVMANWLGRANSLVLPSINAHTSLGGFASMVNRSSGGQLYSAPAHILAKLPPAHSYGMALPRKR